MTADKQRRRLQIESLESRQMAAVDMALSGNLLRITGDAGDNSVLVTSSGGRTRVAIAGTSVLREFTGVSRLEFRGNDGHDRFENRTSIPSLAFGGNGNDVLIGGSGNDELRGGNDHDSLYGNSGNDLLFGEAGLDGLYGGDGNDKLLGGIGADRLLIHKGEGSEVQDFASGQDAMIIFATGTKSWTQDEISIIDRGFVQLHLRTQNTRLLQFPTFKVPGVPVGAYPNVDSITFQRVSAKSSSPTATATNHNDGSISIYDRAFTGGRDAGATAIHEIGHNWDSTGVRNTQINAQWSNWIAASNWFELSGFISGASVASGDGKWAYRTDAVFANDYARTNPREDWCETWQAYFDPGSSEFRTLRASAKGEEKLRILDAFFASKASELAPVTFDRSLLLPGRSMTSSNGRFQLILQTDGNLVLYYRATGAPLWATGTNGKTVTRAVMQNDGNLVLFNGSTNVWSSGTAGHVNASLKLQDDGNLVIYRPDGRAVWATGTDFAGAFADSPSRLGMGERLNKGQSIRSADSRFELVMQGDGNLVLYYRPTGAALWATGTNGKSVTHAVMQVDGNLVVYNGNSAVWASGTNGNAGAALDLQNDGNLVIYRRGGQAIWSTGTYWARAIQDNSSKLVLGERLERGRSIRSSDGRFELVMQNDGNLVLYKRSTGKALWATGTNGKIVTHAIMQTDGNLVLYNGTRAVWASGTNGNVGAELVIQNDGNLVIYRRDGRALWATGTNGK